MTFSALDSGLLGPLFATAAMREAFSDHAHLAAMLAAETALARAGSRFDLAPSELGPAIAAIAPASLDPAQLGAATALAGVPTIPFVKVVQERLPAEIEASFHRGATTQDILDTAFVLQARQGLDLLAPDLDATLAGLTRLAQAHRATACVGRSYGQQAQPLAFGFKVAVWAAGICEPATRLPDLRGSLPASLGGPVGTLSALGERGPAVADAYAAELGLAAPPIAWHTRRTVIVELGTWLAILIGALAKMATDVAHFASSEVGEVAEPHIPGRGGSSAMPHKRNPVAATVILAAHAAAPGFVSTLLTAMAAGDERPAGLWHAEWHALPSLFGLASGALAEARGLAEGLVVDPDRMRANLEVTKGLLFADAVAASLSPKIGRGAAHERLARAADRVRETGRTLREVLAADPDISSQLSADQLDAAFDVRPAIQASAAWIDRVSATVTRARAELRSLPAGEM